VEPKEETEILYVHVKRSTKYHLVESALKANVSLSKYLNKMFDTLIEKDMI